MNERDVLIIIVNYNSRNYVVKCIDSLIKNPIHCKHEIIVIDNNSNDDSVYYIKSHYPEVDLRVNKENHGFAAANNQVFNATKGKYVILLNPDTVVPEGALDLMFGFMENHPEAGIVAPMLLNEDLSLQHSVRNFPDLWNEIKTSLGLPKYFGSHSLLGHYKFASKVLSDPVKIDQPQGACLMVRREAVSGEFLFDPRFFMYYEEVDLCYRVRSSGWEIYYIPQAKVIHAAGKSFSKNIDGMIRQQYRSKFIYYRKNCSAISSSLLIFLTIMEMGYRIAIYYSIAMILRKNRIDYLLRIKAYFRILACLLHGGLPD